MTPDQLASARAAHWREDAQPILSLDDAKAWLERMQLCLYLPRKSQLLAPAPSFAGAVLGSSSATPPPETIQQAHDYLVRLVTEGFVVPLNLFGTPGEQPDFLIVTSALPQLAALQADRNWKKPPARTGPGKVSPLATEIWKLLEREGVLTATEIREELGHELTEAATIRGLSELWQNMRVAPLPQGAGEPANWEILSVTHKKEMAKGSTMSQSTALSLLVSDYVQSVLTATAEDIEAFLSPIASRSRLRDVIRGLGATRQLKTLSMDAQTFLFVEGTLPDMPETTAPSGDADKPAFMGRSAYRERMLNKTKEDGKSEEEKTEDTSPRTYNERRGETGTDRPRRAAFSDRSRPSADQAAPSRFGSSRPDSGRRDGGAARPSRFGAGGSSRPSRPSFGDRARGASSRPPFRRSEGASGADRPRSNRSFRPRTESDRPRPQRAGGEGRPFTPRPFTPREGGRPPFRSKPAAGGDRPFRPRPDGDRPRSDRPRSDSRERPSGGRPSFPRREGSGRPRSVRPSSGRPSSGTGRTPRPSGSFTRRDGPPSSGRSSGRPPARPGSRPGTPGRNPGGTGRPDGPRPGSGSPRPGGSRPGGPRPGGSRPSGPRPSGGSRPSGPRPSGGRPGTSRPGGMRPPTRKPKRDDA